MSEKRKRVVLGFNHKLEIIKRLKKGETASNIAQIYGVGRTTVNDIKRNAEKIEQHVLKIQSTDGDINTRKTMKLAKFDQLDTAMYQWFSQARNQGISYSDNVILSKAVEMNNNTLGGSPDFKATKGWLDKFKFRHGIRRVSGTEHTAINDIKHNDEKFKHVSKIQSIEKDIKTRKSIKFDQLDNVMYQWFIQAKSRGIPLSGPIIMNKAVEMNKKLGGNPNFKASMGWLKKFKFRHGIRRLDISGEKLTTFDIKPSTEKSEQHVSKLQSIDGDNKINKMIKPTKFDQLDNAMYQWFIQARSRSIPLSGPIIMNKAVEMNKKLEGDPNFKASIGWLDKFKVRHGIRLIDISGKKCAVNNTVNADFKEQLNLKISKLNLIREQIYNCDETGLYWKVLPPKILASLSEKTLPDLKVQKDRITALVCTNATGNHKLPLVVIGKSEKPQSFKNLNKLPVTYYAQKSAWMDQAIFSKWFHNVFVPEVRSHLAEMQLSQEALLLMDNAPTHPSCELQSDDGKIICLFLPANTSPLIQPMEQGIIENLKGLYRKAFIESLLSSNNTKTVKNFWKKYNIKDVIFNIASAWIELKVSNIKKSWDKLLPINEIEETETVSVEEIVQMCNKVGLNIENITSEEIKDWLEYDKLDGGFEILNDDEIISCVTVTEEDEIDDDFEEESTLKEKPTTSHSEAETMLSKCIDWFEMQEEATVTEILLLYKIRNIAAQKARALKT